MCIYRDGEMIQAGVLPDTVIGPILFSVNQFLTGLRYAIKIIGCWESMLHCQVPSYENVVENQKVFLSRGKL